jgi:hypothetical protein
MRLKIISFILLISFSTQVLWAAPPPPAKPPAQQTQSSKDDRLFWSMVAATGVLFVAGVVFFVQSRKYDDLTVSQANNSRLHDSYASKTTLYSNLAIISMGGTAACGLYSLRLRYEPAGEAAIDRNGGPWRIMACYNRNF